VIVESLGGVFLTRIGTMNRRVVLVVVLLLVIDLVHSFASLRETPFATRFMESLVVFHRALGP
jgi:hypothetical protein